MDIILFILKFMFFVVVDDETATTATMTITALN